VKFALLYSLALATGLRQGFDVHRDVMQRSPTYRVLPGIGDEAFEYSFNDSGPRGATAIAMYRGSIRRDASRRKRFGAGCAWAGSRHRPRRHREYIVTTLRRRLFARG
jgi:hypothetical protein